MKRVTHLNPPEHCDVCHEPIIDKFYDCYVPAYGCWANICPECFEEFECKLGTGQGQIYSKLDDTGDFVKIGG